MDASSSDNMVPIVLPSHVAIIMDGNGRWAHARGLPRVEGHRAGAKTVRRIVEESRRLGIRYLTLYAFSTENWSRPAAEVNALMKLFQRYLRSEIAQLKENGIRLRAIGELSELPKAVRRELEQAMELTEHETGMDLTLAVSYGGRREIVSAVQRISQQVVKGELVPEEIDENSIRQALYAPDIPDPDLLIRTSGESRISNFLLWQLAYSEIVVTEVCWPEFSMDQFLSCLREFSRRDRRFGMTGEQARGASAAAARR